MSSLDFRSGVFLKDEDFEICARLFEEGFSIDENYYVKIGRHSNSEEYIVYSKETWFYDKCLPFFSPDWEKVDIDYNYDVYEFYPRDCED